MEEYSKTVKFLTYFIMVIILVALPIGIFYLFSFIGIRYSMMALFLLICIIAWRAYWVEKQKKEIIDDPIMVMIVMALFIGIFSLLIIINIGYALTAAVILIFIIAYREDNRIKKIILNNPVYIDSFITDIELVVDSFFSVSHTFEYKATTYTAKTSVDVGAQVDEFHKLEASHTVSTIPIIFLETDPKIMMLDKKAFFARKAKKPKG